MKTYSNKILKDFAYKLRYHSDPGSLQNYIKWRLIEHRLYTMASETVNILKMKDFDEHWQVNTEAFLNSLDSHEAHRVLEIEPSEAHYYYYEDTPITDADDNTIRDIQDKNPCQYNSKYIWNIVGNKYDEKHIWAVLGYRRHLVCAKLYKNKITIYNSAAQDFMIGLRYITEAIKFKLIASYEEQWKKMATEIWSDTEIKNIDVIHLDCQGYNDCCIWCWIIPMLKQSEID